MRGLWRTAFGNVSILRVGLLESAALMRGKLLVKLNMTAKPIANKYREGKLQRTLKREFNRT